MDNLNLSDTGKSSVCVSNVSLNSHSQPQALVAQAQAQALVSLPAELPTPLPMIGNEEFNYSYDSFTDSYYYDPIRVTLSNNLGVKS
jgi:hypothetical protein